MQTLVLQLHYYNSILLHIRTDYIPLYFGKITFYRQIITALCGSMVSQFIKTDKYTL